MSNITGDGIGDVKSKACDILLDHRLTQKAKDPKKAEAILNRLHIAEPKKRDNVDRPDAVPQTVLDGVKKTGPTVKELQEEFGGAGVFYVPIEEHYQLEKEEWRYDKFPEFYNGMNVLDFYDPDIEKKLDALEKEEDDLLKMEADEDKIMDEKNADSDNSDGVDFGMLKNTLKKVRDKKALIKHAHKMNSKNKVSKKIKNVDEMIEDLKAKGHDINEE
jgi:nucleolar GTP-binding protein